MPKNIVVCLDGTGNEFGEANSNVVKLFQTLIRNDEQVAYYHPGLGTSGFLDRPSLVGGTNKKFLKDAWSAATGAGLIENTGQAFKFIMRHYCEGDRLYIFGFSRGAYTAKVLCSMIKEFGILDPGDELLVDYAAALMLNDTEKNRAIITQFNKTFGRECKPWFLGLWDAVSSIRMCVDPSTIRFTKHNPNLMNIRHAVSLDERRAYFRTNLFGHAESGQDMKQVWFAGVHSDIGGGYAENESGLSKITLEWMLREAEQKGLLIDEAEKARILGYAPGETIDGPEKMAKPNFAAQIHHSLYNKSDLWGLAEILPKYSWSDRLRRRHFTIPLAEWRYCPEGSLLHESVTKRLADASLNYKPQNIPKTFTVEK